MDRLSVLLQAAEFIEKRDREAAEHTYASSLPMPEDYSRRKSKNNRKSIGSRSTHNESEKNRRAHLRHCMEKLKEIVPVGGEASRHTTLGLLTKAKSHIKQLEQTTQGKEAHRQRMCNKRDYWRKRLTQLMSDTDINLHYRLRAERTISECSSTSTASSTSFLSTGSGQSSLESSESDDVDILGSGSDDCDGDDVSIASTSSDSGCVISVSPGATSRVRTSRHTSALRMHEYL